MHTMEALEQKKPRFRSVNSAPHDMHRTKGFQRGLQQDLMFDTKLLPYMVYNYCHK